MPSKPEGAGMQMKKTVSDGSTKDGTSLKRGREGSQEPSTLPQPSAHSKKNRPDPSASASASSANPSNPPHARSGTEATETSTISEEDAAAGSGAAGRKSLDETGEGNNVGEVRRKVASMTHEDLQSKSAAGAGMDRDLDLEQEAGQELEVPASLHADEPPSAGSAMSTDPPAGASKIEDLAEGWVDVNSSAPSAENGDTTHAATSGTAGEGLKRKAIDRSESTILAGETSKRQKETPSPPSAARDLPAASAAPASSASASTSTPAATTAAPKKTQPTFASFSAASPFASSARTASPFAAASASPFASAGASNAFASSSASTSTPSKPSAFSSSGFGTFSAAASPFAVKKAAPTKLKSAPTKDEEDEAAADEDEDKAEKSNFDDILAQKGDEEEGGERVKMTEQDVATGEEDEETVFSNRVKLYVMGGDGAWKERGTGVLRLNVKASDGTSPRLVMRADGVLRVILNTKVYTGMSAPQDGRHVRTTVFEDGQKKFITFRTGQAKNAEDLSAAIHEQVRSLPATSSKSPEPLRAIQAVPV